MTDRFKSARLKKLRNMTISQLGKLNEKLIGKGHHWLTEERNEVCMVWGEKISEWFAGKDGWDD